MIRQLVNGDLTVIIINWTVSNKQLEVAIRELQVVRSYSRNISSNLTDTNYQLDDYKYQLDKK